MQNNIWRQYCIVILGENYLQDLDTKNRYQKYINSSYYALFKQLMIENKYIGCYQRGPGHGRKGDTHNILIWRYMGKMTYISRITDTLKRIVSYIDEKSTKLEDYGRWNKLLIKEQDDDKELYIEKKHYTVKELKIALNEVINHCQESLQHEQAFKSTTSQFIEEYKISNVNKSADEIQGLDKASQIIDEWRRKPRLQYDWERDRKLAFIKAFYDGNDGQDSSDEASTEHELQNCMDFGLQLLDSNRNYWTVVEKENVDSNWLKGISELKSAQINKQDQYNDVVNNYGLRCIQTEAGYYDTFTDAEFSCGIIEFDEETMLPKYVSFVKMSGGWDEDDGPEDSDDEQDCSKWSYGNKYTQALSIEYSNEPREDPYPIHTYAYAKRRKSKKTMPPKGHYIVTDVGEMYTNYHPQPWNMEDALNAL